MIRCLRIIRDMGSGQTGTGANRTNVPSDARPRSAALADSAEGAT
jgi:hypothetical protein